MGGGLTHSADKSCYIGEAGWLISTIPHFLLLLPSVVPSTRRARPSSLKARMAVTFARCRKTGAGNRHEKQEDGRGEIGTWKYWGLWRL